MMASVFRLTWLAVLGVTLVASFAAAGVIGGDDFGDGVIDPVKWDGPFADSGMEWREQDGQFQFRSVAAAANWPTAGIEWQEFSFLNGYNWSATVDVSNPADVLPQVAAVGEEEVSSVALVLSPSNEGGSFTTVFLQSKVYVENTGIYTAHRIIVGHWADNQPIDISGDILHNFPNDVASLSYQWDATAQELKVLYDADGGQDNLVEWHTLGVDDWNMGPADEFKVAVQGQIINAVVDWDGGIYADDFTASSAIPEPTTLGLLGMGLAGLVLRRRSSSV